MSANLSKYTRAYVASQAVLDFAQVSIFPFDIVAFIQTHSRGIHVCTVDEFLAWNARYYWGDARKWSIRDAQCFFFPDEDNYLIVYNPRQPESRVRFSIAHELGHILLGHFGAYTEVRRGMVPDMEYYMQEGAANTFAGNFLAPPVLIRHVLAGKAFAAGKVARAFCISRAAAESYRRQDYAQWLLAGQLLAQEQALLERCAGHFGKKACANCGAPMQQGQYHCMVCGCKAHTLNGSAVAYTGMPLSAALCLPDCVDCKHRKAVQSYQPQPCRLCRKYPYNKCFARIDRSSPHAECDAALPGYARCCPHCGAKTTFVRYGLLQPLHAPQQQNTYTDVLDWEL